MTDRRIRQLLVLNPPTRDLSELVDAFLNAPDGAYRVHVAASAKELLWHLGTHEPYDLIVVDYLLGDGRQRGAELLAAIRSADRDVPVVAVAEKGDVDLAAEAAAAGAADFLVRGGRIEQRVTTLLHKIAPLLDLRDRNRLLHEQNRLLREAHHSRYLLIGNSFAIREVSRRVKRVANIPRPVLLTGERGTGKELVARAIHMESGRASGPFIAVNCAAFPEALLESELFGHERGSFTGAERLVPGKFEQADRGTLFLDEISHMSMAFQQKVLRVVEYGTFTRVGGTAEIAADVRIVAATNANIQDLIAAGTFLPDLYDRLAFEEIHVPPLRERPEDVPLLAQHFLGEFMREIPALGGKRLSQSALAVLSSYRFPGNVRELKNIIERAAYRDTSNEITPEDIGMLPAPDGGAEGEGFEEKVESFKRRLIRDALQQATGNQAQAARNLGLSYHQFRYYHQRYAKT